MMFVILLISSALGKCTDHKDQDTCLADRPCEWRDEREGYVCVDLECAAMPMKGICEHDPDCVWTEGKCDVVDCVKYPYDKCPTDKGCQKKQFSEYVKGCYPSGWTIDEKDWCSESQTSFHCKNSGMCVWSNGKCKYDGCSREQGTEEACKASAGCKIVTEGGDERFCYPKDYNEDDPYCPTYDVETECDSTYECMTDGKKCKKDPCMWYSEEDCADKSECVYDTPDILKDWEEGKAFCHHKDKVFIAGALDIVPALIQSRIFQLASALLLFLLM